MLFCYLFYFQDFHGCFSSVIGRTTIICLSGQVADDDNLLTIARERAGCAFFRVHFARGSMLISTVRPIMRQGDGMCSNLVLFSARVKQGRPFPTLPLAMIDLQRRQMRDKLHSAPATAWHDPPGGSGRRQAGGLSELAEIDLLPGGRCPCTMAGYFCC